MASLMISVSIASVTVLWLRTVTLGCSTSASPSPQSVPHLLTVRGHNSSQRHRKSASKEGFCPFPQFSWSLGKQVQLLAISSPPPYSSHASLGSRLQLTSLSNVQHWYQSGQKSSLSLLRDAVHSGHHRAHRSTGCY